MSADFNEHSTDAVLSRILTEIRGLRDDMARVEAQTIKTNGRVTELEREKWYQRGVMAAVSIVATVIWNFFTR